jgi:hypothetical protein
MHDCTPVESATATTEGAMLAQQMRRQLQQLQQQQQPIHAVGSWRASQDRNSNHCLVL